MPGSFQVTLRKSTVGHTAATRATVRALGLSRIGETVVVADNPATRGMARAVRFLVEVREVETPAEGIAERADGAREEGR